MGAAPTTMREQRSVEDINDCPLIIFQTYIVSGGTDGSDRLSSTELLVETGSAWVLTGELSSPRSNLRGANIDNKVVMTGMVVGN